MHTFLITIGRPSLISWTYSISKTLRNMLEFPGAPESQGNQHFVHTSCRQITHGIVLLLAADSKHRFKRSRHVLLPNNGEPMPPWGALSLYGHAGPPSHAVYQK